MAVFGIFSDVHGNVDALESVLEAYSNAGVDELYCLGDIVGYGGDPQGCCNLVRKNSAATVIGNHDAAVAGTMEYEYYYSSAREALDAHRNMLDQDTVNWLAALPYTHRNDDLDLLLCHGSPAAPKDFEYIFELNHMEDHAERIGNPANVTFIGHSHLTRSFRYRLDEEQTIVEDVSSRSINIDPDWHYIVTVGSVGQPRDKDARARAVMFNDDDRCVEFMYVDYDIASAANRIFDNDQLPTAFAKRLFLGV